MIGERRPAGVDGRHPKLLLDPQKLVVLGDPLGAGRRAGLDLADAGPDRQIGDRGVLGLARAVRHDGA